MVMESSIERLTAGDRLSGISLTRAMDTEGGRAENEAERVVASRSPRPRSPSSRHPYGFDLLPRRPSSTTTTVSFYFFLLLCYVRFSVAAGEETSSNPPLGTQAPGDILLLHKLIKAIARSRAAMNGKTVADPNPLKPPPSIYSTSNYSTEALKQNLWKKALEYDKIKNVQGLAAIGASKIDPIASSSDKEIRHDSIPYTNHGGCPYNEQFMRANDECNAWKAFIFEYLFPWVLFLAVLGNALTLAVYRSRFLKSAATVLLLAVKAQANLAFAICLTVEMLHYFLNEESPFQEIYYRSRPYTLFLANYFDSLAVWCTLAITLETYICVSFPLSFRRWSKRRTIYAVIFFLMIASGLLHVAYPITRDVDHLPQCPPAYRYRMVTRDGWFYDYERVYFFLHAFIVISLPVLFMAIFSVLIGYHFNRKPMGQRFSERRRCVLRITFATTLCSLVLQTPGLVVFATAAVRGSTLEENIQFCTVNVVTNFLTILNAAAPFLVYLCLNETFRRLLFVQLGSRIVLCPFSRYCRRCYETYARGVGGLGGGGGEYTEAEQSHCGLSPVTNTNGHSSRRTSNRHRDESDLQNNRLMINYKNQEFLSTPTSEEKFLKRNSATIMKEVDLEKPEMVRIIVEEVL